MTQREDKEKSKVKREKMASFFLDLAKLTFATMVLTNFTPIINDGGVSNVINIIVGITLTVILAFIGYTILNY